MSWNLREAVSYYKRMGAPGDQSALVALLKEAQQNSGGALSPAGLSEIAALLAVKESFLAAIVRRIPSLHLADRHVLEVCAGPNCGKSAALAAYAESLQSSRITVKFTPCMRMCGKGPNIKWDGKLYHRADEALIKSLTEKKST